MTLILSWTVVKYLLAELSPPPDPFTDMAEDVCGFWKLCFAVVSGLQTTANLFAVPSNGDGGVRVRVEPTSHVQIDQHQQWSFWNVKESLCFQAWTSGDQRWPTARASAHCTCFSNATPHCGALSSCEITRSWKFLCDNSCEVWEVRSKC